MSTPYPTLADDLKLSDRVVDEIAVEPNRHGSLLTSNAREPPIEISGERIPIDGPSVTASIASIDDGLKYLPGARVDVDNLVTVERQDRPLQRLGIDTAADLPQSL